MKPSGEHVAFALFLVTLLFLPGYMTEACTTALIEP